VELCELPSGLRIEHALESKMEIPSHYDSMIAKFISYGANRDDARRKLVAALDDAVVLGVTTNRVFLSRCLRHPTFAQGAATTAFIAEHSSELLATDEQTLQRALAVAALLLRGVAHDDASKSLALRGGLLVRLEAAGQMHEIQLSRRPRAHYAAELNGITFELELLAHEPPRVRLACDGIVESAVLVHAEQKILLQYRGASYNFFDRTLAQTARSGKAADGRLRASMNGRLVALHASIGDVVKAGQAIFTLGAMKMEHTHSAPFDGRVTALSAELNQQITVNRIVAEIEMLQTTSRDAGVNA
jgi:geranyl-CoA carboxylase alpha subunit